MSDSEDDLIAYGTPLEPLEEDEIPNKKPRLLEDQVVKDKQGRRRFHGAFTGGYSAGFFNTVGSLEGWSPASFKSSKSKKQGVFLQKPEDFMDEEDLSEFGIAPIVLKAKQDYTIQDKKEVPILCRFQTLGNYVLQDLLKPVRETVGIKLLRKMGWKPGQGVGSRLSRKEKKNMFKMRQKTYGCQLPESLQEKEEINSGSDSEWDNLEFAPSDCEPVFCEARNDSSGLGYEGLEKRPVLSGAFLKRGDEGKNKLRYPTQAFGVGAFEEEDEDIYARDDITSYDFALESDLSKEANKSSEKLLSDVDGVLEGFVIETKRRSEKHYTLPRLPKDYTSQHKIRHSRFNQLFLTQKDERNSKVSFEDRKELFLIQGEEVLEGKKQAEELIFNVKISEDEFKPFSSNPEKQKRYEKYLKLVKIGKKELLSHFQPLSMTSFDRRREATEFEKAALLFKPLTGGIGDRFLVAKQPDDLSDPLAVVEKYVDKSDDRTKAAKMNMYGSLTRKTEDWIPSPLLCKRFNIPEPNKSHFRNTEGKAGRFSFDLFDNNNSRKENTERNEESNDLGNASQKESNEDKNEKNEIKNEETNEAHNKNDLFKAIFLASEDEDEFEEKEKNFEKVTGTEVQQLPREKSLQNDLLYEEKLINSRRNMSPPSGIFENIDLESLSASKKVAEGEQAVKKPTTVSTAEPDSFSLNLLYGPKIPDKVIVKPKVFSTEPFQDETVWVEKKSYIEKKHKKKNKKSKKTFRKSKHKHKKSKR